jgi:hypothetical protein
MISNPSSPAQRRRELTPAQGRIQKERDRQDEEARRTDRVKERELRAKEAAKGKSLIQKRLNERVGQTYFNTSTSSKKANKNQRNRKKLNS